MTYKTKDGNFQALVIDDEPQVREFVSTILRREGWTVAQSPSAEDAFERVEEANWSVLFCDVMLGGANGYSVLRHFKEKLPEAKVVLMTGHASAAGALDATAFGAYDYLLKPFGPEELQSLSLALREQLMDRPHRSSTKRPTAPYHSDIELVGRSQAFIEVMKHVGRVAKTNLPVLLTGESGTGKELVASAIHRRSGRAEKPFVAVNCGAIPADLIEAELFGHVKGAFTGADRDRCGLWGRSRWRHRFSRRDYGNEFVFSGKVVARAARGRDSPRRFEPNTMRKCSGDRGQQSRHRAGSCGRKVSERLVLSAECNLDSLAAFARSSGRHSTFGPELCRPSLFVKSFSKILRGSADVARTI